MLKPSVQVGVEGGIFVAEFWDCLRLDPAPVQDLRKRFDEHTRRDGRADLVVDLLGVGFAGSAALGGFVSLQRACRQHGGRMVFCNVDPNVFEVFRVSKLDSLYTFTKDRASALADLDAPPKPSTRPAPAPAESSAPAPNPGPSPVSRLKRRPKGDD